MTDTPITLEFIAEQIRRVQTDVRVLRDEMDVTAAIARRLDQTIGRLEQTQLLMLDELRAMHSSSIGPRHSCALLRNGSPGDDPRA